MKNATLFAIATILLSVVPARTDDAETWWTDPMVQQWLKHVAPIRRTRICYFRHFPPPIAWTPEEKECWESPEGVGSIGWSREIDSEFSRAWHLSLGGPKF